MRGEEHVVTADSPLRIPLTHQGDRIDGLLGDKPILGGTRADGTRITAGVPEPIAFEELGARSTAAGRRPGRTARPAELSARQRQTAAARTAITSGRSATICVQDSPASLLPQTAPLRAPK